MQPAFLPGCMDPTRTKSIQNHQLDFVKYSGNWRGAVATIVPRTGEQVWGAVWKLNNDDLAALDRQEGVQAKEYFPKIVQIKTPNEMEIECRTYQNTLKPPLSYDNEEELDRRPSITYLDCIIKGAMECGLPKEYIAKLKKLPTNGKTASPELLVKL